MDSPDKNETFVLFHLIGYNNKNGEAFVDRVDITLIDTSYENALARARLIIDKQWWFLADVTEYFRKDCK